MIIYLFLLIPIFTLIYLLMYHRKNVVWWEALLVLAIPFFVILGIKALSQSTRMFTTEYWTSWGTTAEYYEDWDEKVSCRHPIYETTTHTDSEGNEYTTTTIVGYHHAYDVDYHGPRWVLYGSGGENERICEAKFNDLAKAWQNKGFMDLHRNYHSNDGDMYRTVWNKELNTIEAITTKHTYKNKVKASKSVFSFKDVDPKVTKVCDYSPIGGYDCNYIYNGWSDSNDQLLLKRWNALLGAKKKVCIIIIPYLNRPIQDAFDQEAYWVGGNKNEFIVCVGYAGKSITWVRVISWTPQTTLKAQIERELAEFKEFNMPAIINHIGKAVHARKGVIRRDFDEFNYLSVPVPWWGYILAFIASLLATVILAVVFVENDCETE